MRRIINKKQNNIEIAILSNYIGCKLASIILKDFNINTTTQLSLINKQIVVIDQNMIELLKNINQIHTIILIQDNLLNPGHILAQSGHLNTFGQHSNQPFIPKYLVQITTANTLSILLLQLLLNPHHDKHLYKVSLIDIISYFGAFNISARYNHLCDNALGSNVLDGGMPFYQLYQCKDKNIIAVGNLQPKFYNEMVKALQFNEQEEKIMNNQFDQSRYVEIKQILSKKFKEKNALQWEYIMKKYDTCITAVKKFDKKSIKAHL